MQIVIDIPDEDYNFIMQMDKYRHSFEQRLIYNGIPLPKRHGDLIDRNEIGLTNFDILLCNGDFKEALKLYDQSVCNALPIIKEDVENKNSENIPMEYFESGGI